MSNLLRVVRLKGELKKGTLPLMMEVPVDPTLMPVLVSSTTGFVWIEEAHPGDIVKAAVRKIESPGVIFVEILQKIEERSHTDQWGSVSPYSEEGVREAIKYLEFYEVGAIELLVPFRRKEGAKEGSYARPAWLTTENFNVPLRSTSWLHDDCVVAVPVDRDYVGTFAHFNLHTVVAVVHNASRGVAIARGVEPPTEEAVAQLSEKEVVKLA